MSPKYYVNVNLYLQAKRLKSFPSQFKLHMYTNTSNQNRNINTCYDSALVCSHFHNL